MPRRLTPPEPPLADDQVRLEPLTQEHVRGLLEMIEDDDVKRFTLVPTGADEEFVTGWVARYEAGWDDASRAGFAIRGVADGAFLGFASIVRLDLEAREGEIGYALPPPARGRGVAGRSVELLTRWGFGELGLVRLELRIDIRNPASERVAKRAGYERDGVLRSLHFKEGLRCDLGIWSRLSNLEPHLIP